MPVCNSCRYTTIAIYFLLYICAHIYIYNLHSVIIDFLFLIFPLNQVANFSAYISLQHDFIRLSTIKDFNWTIMTNYYFTL